MSCPDGFRLEIHSESGNGDLCRSGNFSSGSASCEQHVHIHTLSFPCFLRMFMPLLAQASRRVGPARVGVYKQDFDAC